MVARRLARKSGPSRLTNTRGQEIVTIHPHRAALTAAILLGGWHFLWSLLVAVGWAQPLIDFIFWIHFLRPVYVVERFNIASRCS
jgi:hypothetical protein